MALQRILDAKEDRRLKNNHVGEGLDIPFLLLLLLLLCVGLVMLYSASYAQSEYDTGYTQSTRYLQKQAFCAVIGLGAMAVISHVAPEHQTERVDTLGVDKVCHQGHRAKEYTAEDNKGVSYENLFIFHI